MNLFNFFNHPNSKKGFSIVEILVVAGLTIFMTITLLNNVLRKRVSLGGTVRLVVSDIRTAQADALASRKHNNTFRCGYGVHLLSSSEASGAGLVPNSSYYLYVSKDTNCSNTDYNPSYADIYLMKVIDPRMQICSNPGSDGCNLASGNDPRFEDIFFRSPGAQTYVKNKACPTSNFSQIVVRKKNATCPSSDCMYICVYPTGRIESRSTVCPALSC